MAVATESAIGTILLAGDLAGSSNANSPQLTPTGVAPGVYKGASLVVDSKGRIVHARSLAGYDIPCASSESCGVVTVSGKNNIDINAGSISIKKASKDDYGVVKLGPGFGKDCCEIFVDYAEATATTFGVVTVPTSGHIAIDVDGSISVPAASSSVFGLVKGPLTNGLALTGGTLTYTPSDTSTTNKGFVQIGDGFTVAAGQLSVPTATTSVAGAFRFDGSFTFASSTFSYTSQATAGSVGLVKLGTGLGVNSEGVISRGQGDSSATTKGAVQVTAGNGLNVSAGVLSFTPPDATTGVKGVMQAGAGISAVGGIITPVAANGTGTKGVLASASNKLVIANGLIDFGPDVVVKDVQRTYTKAQNVAKVTQSYAATTTLNLTLGNVFDMTLTGNVNFATPSNLISGGQYILILRQDATGGRAATWSSAWKFLDAFGNATLGSTIGTSANAVSIVRFTVVDTQLIAHIQNNFA